MFREESRKRDRGSPPSFAINLLASICPSVPRSGQRVAEHESHEDGYMPQFLISEPAEAVLDYLADALDQLEHFATASSGKKNIEVVLSTRVIDGHPGSGKIEAAYFW